MAKYRLYARVVCSKYLGVVDADTTVEAIQKAYDLEETNIDLCHHCSSECEDPFVDDITAELDE